MSYLVRSAEQKDIAAVYDFICLLEETSFSYHLFESVYTENIRNNNQVYLVAESVDGKISGFISCHMQNLLHHCGKVAEIQELYVAEDSRSLGVGKSLVKEIETKVKPQGCILLEVTAQNKRASTHQFYENLGFESSHKKFTRQLV